MIFGNYGQFATSGASGRGRKALVAAALLVFVMSAAAMDVKVTITNNTAKPATSVSSSFGFPQSIPAWRTHTFKVYTGQYSSHISAIYASGQTQGGCRFEVGHTLVSAVPSYRGTGKGYGNVLDPFCFVHVMPKWSAPYSYDVNLMISQ